MFNPFIVFDPDSVETDLPPTLKVVPSEPNLIYFPQSAFMQMTSYAIDTQIRNLIETYGYAEVMNAFTTRFQGGK